MSEAREELAWTAGFFDGEGWVGIQRYTQPNGRKRCRLSSHIAQIHKPILSRVRRAIGRGTLHGPYYAKQKNRKPYFVYQTSGFEDTQHLVACLWPWLSRVKRQQAKKALRDILPYYEELAQRKSGR